MHVFLRGKVPSACDVSPPRSRGGIYTTTPAARTRQATRQTRQTVFGIGGTELVLILFFGFLVFGPDKLPQMGRTLGRAIRQFRETSEQMNQKFKEEVYDPFQEAVAPVKDAAEKNMAPYKDDIDSIKGIINDTKSMVNEPFKDIKAQGDAMKKSIDPFASDPVPTGDAGGAIRDRAGRLPRQKAAAPDEAGDDAATTESAAAAETGDGDAKAAAPNDGAEVAKAAVSGKDGTSADAPGKASASKADAKEPKPAKKEPSASPSKAATPAGEKKPLPTTDAGADGAGAASPKRTVAASLYGLDDEDGE